MIAYASVAEPCTHKGFRPATGYGRCYWHLQGQPSAIGLNLVWSFIMVPMTVSVNIHEAKTHLSRLLEQVAAGERVVISKAGTPIADLVPHQAATVMFGGLKGEIAYDDQAFDIDPDIQQMFYHTGHSQPGEANEPGRPGGDAAP
jgi:prevent-host-death family protein